MRSQSDERLMTAGQLECLYLPNKSTELVRGRLIVREPPGARHGIIQAKLGYLVTGFVLRNALGVTFGQDTGFRIGSGPDTVRAPDLAFVLAGRTHLLPARGYAALAPDLAVEIVSPDDRPGELFAKVGDWLKAGVRLVWVIDPERQEARVHRPDGSLTLIPHDGMLEGEDVLPGFSCALAEVLA